MTISDNEVQEEGLSRRHFLGGVGGAVAAFTASGLVTMGDLKVARAETGISRGEDWFIDWHRRYYAYNARYMAAISNKYSAYRIVQRSNSDEDRYPNKIGSYSKGLPHDELGEVDQAVYSEYLRSILSRKFEEIEMLARFWEAPARMNKLVNPLGGVAFTLEGPDPQQLTMPPAPKLASAEAAGEAVELYWI